MNTFLISQNKLTAEFPQLTDKMLVDFVNGLEVMDDHIKFSAKVNSDFITRTWSLLNGESANRQHVINQNAAESLNTVSTWLQQLQTLQIQSDQAIVRIGGKLLETRKGLILLAERHKALAGEVNIIISRVDDLEQKHSQLEIQIKHVDSGRLAGQQKTSVFNKWQAGQFAKYPLLVRLFLALDELYWGDFGHYLRTCPVNDKERRDLLDDVKNQAIIQLKKDWGAANNPAISNWQNTLLAEFSQLQPELREAIAYLADEGNGNQMPMLWSLNRLANNPDPNQMIEHTNLPFVLTPENAVNRFLSEFEVRYANEHN